MRSRLRLPHLGQRIPSSSSWHQDIQEGSTPRDADSEDERIDKEDHRPGAENSLRDEERLCRVARGETGTTRAPQVFPGQVATPEIILDTRNVRSPARDR